MGDPRPDSVRDDENEPYVPVDDAEVADDAGGWTTTASYLCDAAHGEDHLETGPDVDAMASLIASWHVEPPLSIALFGGWGSGKSFFVHKLQERVRQIASAAQRDGRAQREVGFYKNIVQVDFNAWHHVEGQLWTSLIARILSNLRVGEDDSDDVLRARREALIAELTEQEQSAIATEGARRAARARLAKAEKRLVLPHRRAARALRTPHDRWRELGVLMLCPLVVAGILLFPSAWLAKRHVALVTTLTLSLSLAAIVFVWWIGARRAERRLGRSVDKRHPRRALRRFLAERATADDQHRHPAVPALVVRDVARLTAMFQRQRRDELCGRDGVIGGAPPSRDPSTVINRIVLYIEDLDRCPAETVVEVLRAIHRLLASPLFVVVVAVDARWLAHALQAHHAGQLADATSSHEGAASATSEDFLEKVFQLPFWLPRFDAKACKQLVLGVTAPCEPALVAPPEPARSEVDAPAHGEQEGGPDSEVRRRPALLTQPETEATTTTIAADEHDAHALAHGPLGADPRALALTDDERGSLAELAACVAASPRAAKRIVNCYRLFRATEAARVARGGESERGSFLPAMTMLALATAMPRVAVRLADALQRLPDAAPATSLLDALRLVRARDDRALERDFERVQDALHHLSQTLHAVTIAQLRAAAPRVLRYAFGASEPTKQ